MTMLVTGAPILFLALLRLLHRERRRRGPVAAAPDPSAGRGAADAPQPRKDHLRAARTRPSMIRDTA
jgi:hypothetical protein